MYSATFCFFAELNDLLPPAKQNTAFEYPFKGDPSIKHMIEALGVPHTEVSVLIVNRRPVDFSHPMSTGDVVSVYPPSLVENFPAGYNLQPPPPRPERFVLDNHLGKLATYLRILGLDALFGENCQDAELARISSAENRILLTRDRRLLMRNQVTYGYCVRSLNPERQILEILDRYHLYRRFSPFQRCLRCNTPLEPVDKARILDRLQPLTRRYYDEFHFCPHCDQVFWPGSHYARMVKFLNTVIYPHMPEEGESSDSGFSGPP